MPKRTREQKMKALDKRLAHLHEKTTGVQQTEPLSQASLSLPNILPFSKNEPEQSLSKHSIALDRNDTSYVRHDLLRVLSITAALLACQFIIFWLVGVEHIRIFGL